MTKKLLRKALNYDSLHRCLKWSERVRIHLHLAGRLIDFQTPNIVHLCEHLKDEEWQPPETRYQEDRLLYFWNGKQWQEPKKVRKLNKLPKL